MLTLLRNVAFELSAPSELAVDPLKVEVRSFSLLEMDSPIDLHNDVPDAQSIVAAVHQGQPERVVGDAHLRAVAENVLKFSNVIGESLIHRPKNAFSQLFLWHFSNSVLQCVLAQVCHVCG